MPCYSAVIVLNKLKGLILFEPCRTLSKVAEKIDSLDVWEKLKNTERRLTDLVEEKIGNATKMTCDKVEKNICCCRCC